MRIEVLGPGCRNCETLEERTRRALASLDLDEEITEVSDLAAIAAYGVMTTPALAIDGHVVLAGRVPGETELRSILVAAGAS